MANVSHELRTPLNMIIGFSEMISHTPQVYGEHLVPALLADIEIIQRNAQHLSSLIDDVLDLSQAEADRMTLHKERTGLEDIVKEAIIAVEPLFESKGLYLTIEQCPELPDLYCDRTRIRQILLNLLSNAVRFTDEGGVRLRLGQDGRLGAHAAAPDLVNPGRNPCAVPTRGRAAGFLSWHSAELNWSYATEMLRRSCMMRRHREQSARHHLTFHRCKIGSATLRDRLKRSAILRHLLQTYHSDEASCEDNKPHDVPAWEAWLAQSGELPPDFDQLPTNAFLPNVLEFDDGSSVTSVEDWQRRRQEVLTILETYQLGKTVPPPPKMTIEEVSAARDDGLGGTVRQVRLVYGPSALAVSAEEALAYCKDSCMYRTVHLNVECFIPDGQGPFPAIVEVGNHPSDRLANTLALRSSRRDYVVCIFNSVEAFAAHHVYAGHNITELGWWAYAAGRCLDYLSHLDMVDPDKIAVIGHSRGGKMALLAAALDERFAAVIASHTGTGAGTVAPWRYAGEKFGAETLEASTRYYPYWNHPRLRFFAGRENKLPFDSHFLMALVAPRPMLVTEGDADDVGEPWGGQQAYLATKGSIRSVGSCRSPEYPLPMPADTSSRRRFSINTWIGWICRLADSRSGRGKS